jgi:hypothetical protein
MKDVYRPTVRYAPAFRDYVDEAFKATTLDRNQIIRAALFAAAHSKEFNDILMCHKKKDVPLPCPEWRLSDHGWWMDQCPTIERGGEDVNVDSSRRDEIKNASRNDETRSVLPPNVSPAAVPTANGRIAPVERRNGQIPAKRLPDGRIPIRTGEPIVIRLD